jgi:hypothetical protein
MLREGLLSRYPAGCLEAACEAVAAVCNATMAAAVAVHAWLSYDVHTRCAAAMVAAKAAAAAPQRVASLTLLGYALNGWQMAASLVTRPHRLLPVCFPLP